MPEQSVKEPDGDIFTAPLDNEKTARAATLFWRDRFFECALILSMACYYLIGNPQIALPFLFVFAILSWYRLPFAIALLPLSLPYYLDPYQKVVAGSAIFSLAEITLGSCLVIAILRTLCKQEGWPSWAELRDRIGPFAIPMLVFLGGAALSIIVAYRRDFAIRDLRKEVIDPLLYFALVLIYLRSRQDVMRLLAALLGTGLLIAALGLAQYLFFKHALVLEEGTRRVHAVYGSANSIGLLFDYILPLGLAWLMAREGWKMRLLALVLCIPMVVVLYLTQSRGAWVAVAVATLFVAMFSLHNKQLLLAGSLIILVGLVAVLVLYHSHILNYFIEGHTNQQGVSTVTKRIYLWRSALHMLHDSPWFGYGLDNWLCHYSKNTICDNSLFHYWIVEDPPGRPTGLRDEPFLSHPHNIFLHVWVSMGIFGLLAFSAVLVLFYWLFGRILVMLRSTCVEGGEQLRWMTLGVGAALLAALVQGQVDSAFLEQDLAFCFWTLVAALLLLRTHSLTSWQDVTKPTLSP